MKNAIVVILFTLFIAAAAFNDKIVESINYSSRGENIFSTVLNEQKITDKINNQFYDINVKLNPEDKSILAEENITWINNSSFPTKEIFFHLYANAYKSNNTLFAKDHKLTSESMTHYEIDTILVDGNQAELIYLQSGGINYNDSSVAKIKLRDYIEPGDSTFIFVKYKLKIPRSIDGFGYATGRNFFFISEWFLKIAVYEEGRWTSNPLFPSQKFYHEYADYNVDITVPHNYTVGGSGRWKKELTNEDAVCYSFDAENVNDFSWFATDEIIHDQQLYLKEDNTSIRIDAFVQPERESYIGRYLSSLKNALKYYEQHIGSYPYQHLTFVDVPRSCESKNIYRSTLFTLRADLFSPDDAKDLEFQTIIGFSNLYFNNLFSSNEINDAWLGKGIADYFTQKIMAEYYEQRNISFRLAKYFPIYGLNFLSHYEIPIIYTLGIYKYKEDTESMRSYLAHQYIGAIADTTYRLPNSEVVKVNSIYKPQLMLLSLERYIGKDKLLKIFSEYYRKYRFIHPKSEDLIELVQENTAEDMTWFFNNLYASPYRCDYSIDYVKQISRDRYEVFVKKRGKGFFKTEIALYTDSDTLYSKWDGKTDWKKIIFTTENDVIGAEIDPSNKNVMDTNYANNSYAIGGRYAASLSLAVRVFFWIQNALIILGAIG